MFREKAALIKERIEALAPKEFEREEGITLSLDGREISVPPECYEIVQIKETVAGESFIPRVIEPSYGIDRIFYVVLEHAYTVEGGRVFLRLPPRMAPVTVGVFPLMAKDGLDQHALEISGMLSASGITSLYDDDGSIGRRYARADEVGVPYCITTDYQTLEDDTVTIRDRDSTHQRRVSGRKLVKTIATLLKR
jgi:glycyl-tRNA synthetase